MAGTGRFWPDGIYTAPSDEALRYDIEMTRKLGFNMARKHIKVEPDRWYYWADISPAQNKSRRMDFSPSWTRSNSARRRLKPILH